MITRWVRAGLPGVAIAAWLGLGLGQAQEIELNGALPAAAHRGQHVELVSGDVLRTKAGSPRWVALRFEVDPGFHINSHTPHDELLIPTVLAIPPEEPLKVLAQRYPAGIPLHLAVGAGEVLSTYQGEFLVELQVTAPKGSSVLAGSLRYQACDARACFPPRTLPVRVTVQAD